jgi:hypothetical protein
MTLWSALAGWRPVHANRTAPSATKRHTRRPDEAGRGQVELHCDCLRLPPSFSAGVPQGEGEALHELDEE